MNPDQSIPPGEAREADLGVAAGRGNGMIYRQGKAIRRVTEDEIVPALLEEIEKFVAEKSGASPAQPPVNQDTEMADGTAKSLPILK